MTMNDVRSDLMTQELNNNINRYSRQNLHLEEPSLVCVLYINQSEMNKTGRYVVLLSRYYLLLEISKIKKNEYQLNITLEGKNILLGYLKDINSQVIVQVKSLNSQFIMQYYQNGILQNKIEVMQNILTNETTYWEYLFKEYKKYENFLDKIFVFLNYSIIESQKHEQTDISKPTCLVEIKSLTKEDQTCLYFEFKFKQEKPPKMKEKQKRILSSSPLIEGSKMMSLVRHKAYNSDSYLTIPNPSTLGYTNFLIIGYFQMLSSCPTRCVLIAIGTLSSQQIHISVDIHGSTPYFYLRYMYNNDLQSSKTSINFDSQLLLVGIYFSYSDQTLSLISSTDSVLHISSTISITTLFTGLDTLDLCIACFLQEQMYQDPIDYFSTVKIIYNVDITKLDGNILQEELSSLDHSSFLSSSFSYSDYIQGSEYNPPETNCNSGYSFFEGVCIKYVKCSSLQLISDNSYNSFEVGKFHDSSLKRCVDCSSNCISCTSLSNCTVCRQSYVLNSGQCVRCDDDNACDNNCPSNQSFDPLNEMCVVTYSQTRSDLINNLLSSRIFNDNTDISVTPQLAIEDSIILCYIKVYYDPMTLYAFLGGPKFSSTTVLQKSWSQVPSGYQKLVQFYALFYGNGTPWNLKVLINQQEATLNPNYKKIYSKQKSCGGTGSSYQYLFYVTFYLDDTSQTFDLSISSSYDHWAVRDISITVMKCHPTCDSCLSGGTEIDCVTCGSNLVMNQNQCFCQDGEYIQYGNCFDIPCTVCTSCSISNCQLCENLTGNCVLCDKDYLLNDGQCIPVTTCHGDYYSDGLFCVVYQEIGFQWFSQDQVAQYYWYWYWGTSLKIISCLGRECPQIQNQVYQYSQFTMPNFEDYHYKLNFTIDIYAYGSISHTDFVKIFDNTTQIFSQSLALQKDNLPHSPSSAFLPVSFQEYKSSDQIFLQFYSDSSCSSSTCGYSWNSLTVYYQRCHPTCSSCTKSNSATQCSSCIANAKKVNSKCVCNAGYYFTYSINPVGSASPGQCLPCNTLCKTCSGPHFRQCTSCRNGVVLKDKNTCVNCLSFINGSCGGNQIQEFIDFCTEQGYSNYDQSHCSTCQTVTSKKCGRSEIQSNCNQMGWILYNSNTCINCSNYVKKKCGGDLSAEMVNACTSLGFKNYSSTQCASCRLPNQTSCGRDEISSKCDQDGWIYKNSSECMNCSVYYKGSCSSDGSSTARSICTLNGFYNYDSKSCSSCRVFTSNACGRSQIKDQCSSSGWENVDSKSCVNCTILYKQTSQCGNSTNQKAITACKSKGYYPIGSTQCSTCSYSTLNQCGISSISSKCYRDGWDQSSSSTCQLCGSKGSKCSCFAHCTQCTRYYNQVACTSCDNTTYLYNTQCLKQCPNGYVIKGRKCIPCTNQQDCNYCYNTCLTCAQHSDISSPSSCSTCSFTRILQNGVCACLDPEDDRQFYFECSYMQIAVLQAVLSNSSPLLTIGFGKQLNIPSKFQSNTYSNELCVFLFTEITLNLLGLTSQCAILNTQILVNLDSTATVVSGDYIYLNPVILSFNASFDTLIQSYLNNIVVQQKVPLSPVITFSYNSPENSCNDISISLANIVNGAGRGIYKINWLISSITPQATSTTHTQKLIERILSSANKNQFMNLAIPKGVIKVGTIVNLQIAYTLFTNVSGSTTVSLKTIQKKQIDFNFNTPILLPFYKYKSGILTLSTVVKMCTPKSDQVFQVPINISVVSVEQPSLNYQNSSFIGQEYIFQFQPYSLPVTVVSIAVNIVLVSDITVKAQGQYDLTVTQSPLFVQIFGGNGYVDYRKPISLSGIVRDLDIEDINAPQGITVQWECFDLATNLHCQNTKGKVIGLKQSGLTVSIPGSSFSEFSVLKMVLTGTKPVNRSSQDFSVLLLSELDMPPLQATIKVSDPHQSRVNINEDILITVDYPIQINSDLLTFSGALLYNNNVVGVISFDYTVTKFQIWNYFNEFNINNNQIQIRLSVFNPYYVMPSVYTISLQVNFPPINCVLDVIPRIGFALTTQYIISMQNCIDVSQPISYQFFYYQDSNQYEQELLNPQLVQRRQLNDISQNIILETVLPAGSILILVQAINYQQAIYNQTMHLNVTQGEYNELGYLTMISTYVNSTLILSPGQAISKLSILCDDIYLRPQFAKSPKLNDAKIDILNKLLALRPQLPVLSMFQTVVDKAIGSLIKSGINYNQSQETALLSNLISFLNQSAHQNSSYIQISQQRLQQNLFDTQQIINSLTPAQQLQNAQQIMEIAAIVGQNLFINTLPNQNPMTLKGDSVNIESTQITQKYMCSYFMCGASSETQSNTTKQSPIYNVTMISYKNNPYFNTSSFLNYTTTLMRNNSLQRFSNFSLITPILEDPFAGKAGGFDKQVVLSYNNVMMKNSSVNSMVCLSLEGDKWTKSNCYNSFNNKTNQFQCICSKPTPTTIIEDISDLFATSNLGTAFGLQGEKNLSKFTDFYRYGVVWVLIAQTLAFVILYWRGVVWDRKEFQSKQMKKLLPHQQVKFSPNKIALDYSATIFPESPIVKQNSPYNGSMQASIISPMPEESTKREDLLKDFKKNGSIFDILTKSSLSQSPTLLDMRQNSSRGSQAKASIFGSNIKNIKKSGLTKSEQEKDQIVDQPNTPFALVYENNQELLNSQNTVMSVKNSNDNIQFRKETSKNMEQNDSIIEEKPKRIFNMLTPFPNSSINMYKLGLQAKVTPQNLEEEKSAPSPDIEEIKELQNEPVKPKQEGQKSESNTLKDKLKSFQTFSKWKQILVFHNFFSIFILFNPALPRPLRFLIFYLRIVHSLGISVVFDKTYTIDQNFVLSAINAFSILIIVKLLSLFFSLKSNCGIIISRVSALLVLTGYYYIILSIVSGESAESSNKFITTFFLYFSTDLFGVSIFSAIVQKYIASFLLSRREVTGFQKLLFKLVELQLILLTLDLDMDD